MLMTRKVWMEFCKEYRDVIIYLPNNYKRSKKRYPVLYINDGQNAFIDEKAYAGKSWGFIEYVKKHKIDVIMVAVYCGFKPWQRETEYGPWVISEELSYQETKQKDLIIGGLGDQYVSWLINDLKPMIDLHYRTIKEDTAIVGSSMGGIISAYASLAYPHVFKKCAALSTAFWFYTKEFSELIQKQDLSAIECFYFDIGSDEGCGQDFINEWYRETNAEILRLLQPKITHLHFNYVGGASHNEWAWADRLGNFMSLFYKKEG